MARKSLVIACSSFVAAALSAYVGNAEESRYIAPVNGSWTTVSKWDNGVPASDMDAVVDVEGDEFTVLWPAATVKPKNVTIGKNAVIELSEPDSQFMTADSGDIIVRDNAKVVMTAQKELYRLGVGRTVFSDNAVLDLRNGVETKFGGHNAYLTSKESEIVFKDHAMLTAANTAYPTLLDIINNGRTMTTTLRYESDQSSVLGAATYIGWGRSDHGYKGTAKLIQSAGRLQTGGQWGLHTGLMSKLNGQIFSVTGIVQITGGTYLVRAAQSANYFIGAIFGRGACTEKQAPENPVTYGELNLSGDGVFINQNGYLVFGMGNAKGVFRQSGGSLSYDPEVAPRWTILGMSGGIGEYYLSNGIADVRNHFYIGGAPIDERSGSNYYTYRSFAEEDTTYDTPSTGKFVIAPADSAKPCAVECRETIHVGYNGKGEVEIGEGAAVVTLHMHMYGEDSTLKFSLGKSGRLGKTIDGTAAISLLRARNSSIGTITIDPGSKLVVDATEFECETKEAWVPLVTAAKELTGTFADEDITVDVTDGTGEVVQNRAGHPNSIWFHYRRPKRGLTLLFK